VEIKNLNSFRALKKALEYEVMRHIQALEEGEPLIQETRTWDENKGITLSMRTKEEAHDYRYFPDPDLVPVIISREWVEEIRRNLPELPQARKERFMREYGLPAYDASIITSSKALAEYFDACVALYPEAKTVSNWLMGDLIRSLNAEDQDIRDCRIRPEMLVEMLRLIDNKTISGKIAKTVFEEMFQSGKKPADIVKEKGLVQITDQGEIEAMVDQVIEANPKSVEDFKSGKEKAIGFLVGQVMKLSKGKANPNMVNELLRKKLK
jgi:aspartyl-tRNA(Asn)/glutamyl-tRNA(Gln) amidotransferase subunit B